MVPADGLDNEKVPTIENAREFVRREFRSPRCCRFIGHAPDVNKPAPVGVRLAGHNRLELPFFGSLVWSIR